MSQVVRDGDRLILNWVEPGSEQPLKMFDFQLLSPLLLGLLLPFFAASYLDPASLQHVKVYLWLFLLLMFAGCLGLFIYTAVFPGALRGLVIDRKSRKVELVWRSVLTTTSQIIPFQDVSGLRVRQTYAEDGLPIAVAELVLRNKSAIVLPDSTSEVQLSPLRAAIGLG